MYDCIVIGGGPAGACVSYNLAKKYRKVLVLEKYKFPKYKPCAGGITLKGYNLLDFSLDNLIEFESKNFILSINHSKYKDLCGSGVITYMVERKIFDDYFINKAIEKGAELIEEINVVDIIYDNNSFLVKSSAGDFKCKYLVGADGTYSYVNKRFKIVNTDLRGFAVEINYPLEENEISKYKQTFEFGVVPNGYLWIFPKKKHLCIGAYTAQPKLKELKQYLKDYLTHLGFNDYEENDLRGHNIPFYGINYIQPNYPCILVGDAAGFSDYWTGEGIAYALKSGTIAAEVIDNSLKSNHFDYKLLQKKYDKEIIKGLKLGYHMAKYFYKNSPFYYRIISNKFVTRVLIYASYIGMTYDQINKKGVLLFFKSLSDNFKVRKINSVCE